MQLREAATRFWLFLPPSFWQARNYVLLVAFVVGLCLGIIVSERAYIQRVPNPGQPRRNLILSQDDAAMAETPKVEKQAKTDAAPPRSDLEALLRRCGREAKREHLQF
eukprot:scaffold67212_cov19-Tisochrysis_lutea.AAC.1